MLHVSFIYFLYAQYETFWLGLKSFVINLISGILRKLRI